MCKQFSETSKFQLTTSRRGRRCGLRRMDERELHFNSLPHAEVDYESGLITQEVYNISTHYLTQRQTNEQIPERQWNHISTHYLTQRQTALRTLFAGQQEISTHYLTQRQTIRPVLRHGARTFQLTTSRRGRQKNVSGKYHVCIFQLTTSRRGRRKISQHQL